MLKFCVFGFICGVCVVICSLICPSLGASRGLCIVIVIFPRYLRLFFSYDAIFHMQ